MNLTGTTQTVELVTSTTETINYITSYSDIDKTGTTSYTPGSSQGVVTTATDTTIINAPSGASIYRVITSIAIRNSGTATNIVTIQKDVGGTEYTISGATLASGESLHYEDSEGWYVLDSTGSRKGVGATGADGVDGGGTILGTGTSEVDFGAGATDATVTVTGQTNILANSLVYVWVKPTATVDHSADEHLVETLKVFAKDIVAGVGFTIHAFNTSQINEPYFSHTTTLTRFSGTGQFAGPGQAERAPNANTTGGKTPFITGKWTIGWMYTQ